MDKLTEELQRNFARVMQREGKTATIWGTDETFNVFFRRFSDNRQMRNTVTAYYAKDTSIGQGTLFKINNVVQLVLNQETAENEVYYRSACIQCNGILTTKSGSVSGIPFYTSVLDSAQGNTDNPYTTLVDGKMQLVTSARAAENIQIDDRFSSFGRSWKVTNFIYVDGIMIIYCEMTAESPDSGSDPSGSDDQEPITPSEGVSIQLQTEDVYYILEDNPIPYTVTSDGERVQDAVLNIEFSNITTNGQFRATYDDEFIHVVCVNADDVFRSGSVDITVSVVGTDATVTKTFKTLII